MEGEKYYIPQSYVHIYEVIKHPHGEEAVIFGKVGRQYGYFKLVPIEPTIDEEEAYEPACKEGTKEEILGI